MKIAIQNPSFIFTEPLKNFNGYNLQFLKQHTDYIYLSRPLSYFKYKKRLRELAIGHIPILLSTKSLNNYVDTLLHFSGEPYLPTHTPPKRFLGAKVWHVLDYVFKPIESLKHLQDGGVSHIMGYSRHDKYCEFFKKYYAPYIDKVIDVPFGFSPRFENKIPFEKRDNRCIALGSVNPINDPLCAPGILNEYIDFNRGKKWTHELRRKIAEQHKTLSAIVLSKLPHFPETKNPHYDPVLELNSHKFFVNDEGIMNFPPARTYEGIATGAIMVASENVIYEDLGFIAGKNYIGFKRNDIDDFAKQLKKYALDSVNLKNMQEESLKLAEQYTHSAIANRLHSKLCSLNS